MCALLSTLDYLVLRVQTSVLLFNFTILTHTLLRGITVGSSESRDARIVFLLTDTRTRITGDNQPFFLRNGQNGKVSVFLCQTHSPITPYSFKVKLIFSKFSANHLSYLFRKLNPKMTLASQRTNILLVNFYQ